MSVFAIGDLHLPGQGDKPMDVFGPQWERHFEAISAHWQSLVTPQDIVLLPGDISWAMQLANAREDLEAIAALPGKKILLRGNHDYWWSSISKVRSLLPSSMYALQNDALLLDGQVFCGTRGWSFPTAACPLDAQDEKIYQRELMRLQMSLEAAAMLHSARPWVVLMHFPPLLADEPATEYTRLLERYPVATVVYGHLHGAGIKNGFAGTKGGIAYHLVSCDALQFQPMLVMGAS